MTVKLQQNSKCLFLKSLQTLQKLQRLGDRMSPLIGKGGETDVKLLTCRKLLNAATKKTYRRKILEQFTFYDLYADVINQLTDEEAGRFRKRTLAYAIFEKEDIPSKNKTENCFGEIILPTLEDVTQIERNRKYRTTLIDR